jgi:nitrite reductase/ring-hydroxylating ferredoxin subunit
LKKQKHNRRIFLKVAGAALFGGTLFLWDKMVGADKSLSEIKKITIPVDFNRSFTFHENFIVVKNESGIEVFSSSCTHLGCTIQKVENGVMVCPCHGSVFNNSGEALKGPAIKPLEKLDFTIDEKNQQLTIEL